MRFYLATDGFIDQLGGTKRFLFGNKRFKELLLSFEQVPMAEQGEHLTAALLDYQGENSRQDDVTIVGFQL